MAILKCGKCGTANEITDNRESFFCISCGAKNIASNNTFKTQANKTTENITFLKRGFLALEDGEWKKADEFFEQTLNISPENGEAYLGKLMVELKVRTKEELKNYPKPFDDKNNYSKIIRFGSEELKTEISGYIDYINNRNKAEKAEKQYNEAKALATDTKNVNKLQKASEIFISLNDYRDSVEQAEICLKKAERIAHKKSKRQTVTIKITSIVAILVSVALFVGILSVTILPNAIGYNNAQKLMKEGNYTEAILTFQEIAPYKDSSEKIYECNYSMALDLIEKGDRESAIEYLSLLGDYEDSAELIDKCNYEIALELIEKGDKQRALSYLSTAGDYKDSKTLYTDTLKDFVINETVSAGKYHTVGVSSLGTVYAVGKNDDGQRDVYGWKDIVSVSAGYYHTVGLKSDGTVVATGDNYYDECEVYDWTDIVSVSAGANHTVGLKSDGTVIATGDNYDDECEVDDWTDIVAVSAGYEHTVGLKADGTVVATGDNYYDQCNVEEWTDIIAVSAGYKHTVGLKSDGTVVATGYNYDDQCEVDDWTDIIAVSAGYEHTVGLKADGTVVATGNNFYDRCEVGTWTNIVAVSAGYYNTLGLKSNGTVVAVGDDSEYQCRVTNFKDVKR